MAFDINNKVATCQHCKKATNIEDSKYIQRLMVHYKSQKEVIKNLTKSVHEIRVEKNGTIQSLHKTIGKLLDLMTQEERDNAKGSIQSLRDEIKRHERIK